MRLSKVHPDLKLEATFALVVGLVSALSSLFLFFWGVVLAGILLGYLKGFGSSNLPPANVVGWLVPLTTFLVAAFLCFLGRYLLVTYAGWLKRVTWLVEHVQPRRMAVTFPENREAPGRIAEIREEGKAGLAGRGETVEIRSPNWKLKGLGPISVDAYHEVGPEGIVALKTHNGLIWGFKKTSI